MIIQILHRGILKNLYLLSARCISFLCSYAINRRGMTFKFGFIAYCIISFYCKISLSGLFPSALSRSAVKLYFLIWTNGIVGNILKMLDVCIYVAYWKCDHHHQFSLKIVVKHWHVLVSVCQIFLNGSGKQNW